MTIDLREVPLAELFREIRRRSRASPPKSIGVRAGDLTVDVGSGRTCWAGLTVHLSPRETEVLCVLMAAEPRGLTAFEVGERVWGDGSTGWEGVCRAYVSALRRKLPGLIPLLPARGGREVPYRLAIETSARGVA